MDIDFIVPAKTSSTRVPNKNWREFFDGRSLVDFTIEKLLKVSSPERIYVSCETESVAAATVERHGVRFIQRSNQLTDNSVPMTDWIRGVSSQIPGGGLIGWSQVTDPLFDEYSKALELFAIHLEQRPERYDSLVVCRPWRGYLMSEHCQPIGWSFGEHHTPSQDLPVYHTMPFTFSILTRNAIQATGYHVGRRPCWYVASGPHVDIDTPLDFDVAAAVASRRHHGLGRH